MIAAATSVAADVQQALAWPSCLVNGSVEPRAHTNHPLVGKLNTTCLRERLLHLHGTDRFLPMEQEAQSKAEHLYFGRTQEAAGLLRPTHEVAGCLSPASFLRDHAYDHSPVVMRGCENGTARSSLSDEFLAREAGGWFGGTVFRELDLPLRAYIARYKEPDFDEYSCRTCVPHAILSELRMPTPLRCDELFREADADGDGRAHKRSTENVVLWFSNGDVVSTLHHDGGDFILVQLDGQKRVTLVSPDDSHKIYADFGLDDGVPSYGVSPIDPRAVDTATYPEAASVPLQRTTLSPGDMLFIPHHWWHVVESLAGRNLAYTVQASLPKPTRCHSLAPRVAMSSSSPALSAQRRCWRGAEMPPELQPCLKLSDAHATCDAHLDADEARWALSEFHLTSKRWECDLDL